ncbi:MULTISPECIES: ABC transporter substrate-binding protein [Marinovum]|jgi:ABC-type glycerol-3-phosphate transport system substrate-binding protein|uniref:ABC transporter substrate-binding protein n=1 Tax=Marinovum TaxID=367771 RepID=UPI00237A6801|nr:MULTISPECIES: sugar ABC transporter substrate-binding protein [Marinovum]MDD9744035.1 sugar ABC transporter substrate-binding protein [Marinovum sp. PR37]
MKHLCTTALVASFAMAAPFAPTAADAEEINVVMFGMPYTNGLRKLADDFEAETGIKANIDVIGQDVFENRITLSFTGGTGDIDVVHAPVIQVQRWVAANWLKPITAEVAAMAVKDDILKGPLDAYKINGEQYAVPFMAATGLMTYRQDVLEAAGVGVPETWAEMLEIAPQVTNDDRAAIALRAVPGQGFNMFIFPMIMRAYGGKFFADYTGGDLTPAINSPETLEALKVYIELINDYAPQGAGNFNFAEVNAAAQNGQVVFTVEGTGVVTQIVDPDKSKFADVTGIALPPGGPAGRSPAIAVHGLAIPSSAENPEASARFIEWAVSPETMTKIALAEPFSNFTTGSVAQNAEVIAKYDAVHPDFLRMQGEALNLAIGHYRPLLPDWPSLGAAIGENINAAVNGLMSPEDALAAAEQEMKDILGQ